jgi:hypothetical protein
MAARHYGGRDPQTKPSSTVQMAGSRGTRAMQLETIRDKLPKGRSFPLKTSTLASALQGAAIRIDWQLFLHSGKFWDDRPLFYGSVHFAGSVVSKENDVLWIGCRSVQSHLCQAARAALEKEIVPEFVRWIVDWEALPSNATFREGRRNFERDWQPPDADKP